MFHFLANYLLKVFMANMLYKHKLVAIYNSYMYMYMRIIAKILFFQHIFALQSIKTHCIIYLLFIKFCILYQHLIATIIETKTRDYHIVIAKNLHVS